MEHLEDGCATAVVVNSGNANACAPHGAEHAKTMCRAAGPGHGACGRPTSSVASTGVIGQELNIDAIVSAMPQAAPRLCAQGSDDAAHAIMTTDTRKKEVAVALPSWAARRSIWAPSARAAA